MATSRLAPAATCIRSAAWRTSCSPASADLLRRSLKEPRASSIEPVRILVAEDDADFRDLLALKLGMAFPDADTVCVENGGALIDAFDEKPASVVMIDLQMPVLDGVAVTALLRSRPRAE